MSYINCRLKKRGSAEESEGTSETKQKVIETKNKMHYNSENQLANQNALALTEVTELRRKLIRLSTCTTVSACRPVAITPAVQRVNELAIGFIN